MRILRFVAIAAVIAGYAAMPQLGRWVTTASASSVSTGTRPELANAPANDNDSDDCNSGNPRKQKRCHYEQPNGVRDNDNDVNPDQPLAAGIVVSNADPGDGDTFTISVHAVGGEIDQLWWWVPDARVGDDNGNDNDDSALTVPHVLNCNGETDCWRSSDVSVNNPGTITIYSKARDRSGRESPETATQVRVHD